MLTQNTSNATLKEANTNNDKMSGASKPKVPAWKLRREQMRKNNTPPTALYVSNNDELGGTRSFSSRRSKLDNDDNGSLASAGSTRSSTSCFSRSSAYSRTSRCSSNASVHSSRSFRAVSRVPGALTNIPVVSRVPGPNSSSRSSRSVPVVSRVPGSASSCYSNRSIPLVSRVPGGLDPSVPPAFRQAMRGQRNYLGSVASHSRTDACSTANTLNSDCSSLDSDDDSFDDESSFASLDSDADEEDDAYQQSRNQMASLKINSKSPRSKKSRFRKKTTGVHGQLLGLIAE